MKKTALFLSLAIMLPAISFAIPANPDSHTTPSVINYEALKDYIRTRNYSQKKYDSGLRSWEFQARKYNNKNRAENTLYHQNVDENVKPTFPGIEYRKLCYHWKNCVKRIYKASNGYDNSYKKNVTPKSIYNKGIDLAFQKNKNIPLDTGVRSGVYKLWNWRFITPKNR